MIQMCVLYSKVVEINIVVVVVVGEDVSEIYLSPSLISNNETL